MSKQQKIGAAIIAEIAGGKDIQSAINAILGDGSYESIAADVYAALRK
jgi:hypothetical protein